MKAYQAYSLHGRVTADTPRQAAVKFFATFPKARKCSVVSGEDDGTFFTVVYSSDDWPQSWKDVTRKTIEQLPEGTMKNIRTSELVGAQLDWAVAKCEGNTFAGDFPHLLSSGFRPPQFSTDWAVGGPIIEREEIALDKDEKWFASSSGGCRHGSGPTLLIAAMRCYVASKLGNEVELPKGL